jgi:hypothetical protein
MAHCFAISLTISFQDIISAKFNISQSLRHLLTSKAAFNSHGLTSFTIDGLLNYISTLRPTNQGLVLSVMSQDGHNDLQEAEQAIIQDSIGARVGGRFEFVLYKEIESDSESDSD